MSQGGGARLVHTLIMLLEDRKDFICATNDCKNAYIECARVAAVKELNNEPTLAHLAHYKAVSFLPAHGMEHRGRIWNMC